MPAPLHAVDGAVAPVHPEVVVRRHLRSELYGDSLFEMIVRGCIGCVHFGIFMTGFVLTVLIFIRVDEMHTKLMPPA